MDVLVRFCNESPDCDASDANFLTHPKSLRLFDDEQNKSGNTASLPQRDLVDSSRGHSELDNERLPCKVCCFSFILARLHSQTINGRWCLSSSVTLSVGRVGGRPPPGRARGPPGGWHCTAGQYLCIPLRQHLVPCVRLMHEAVSCCFYFSIWPKGQSSLLLVT